MTNNEQLFFRCVIIIKNSNNNVKRTPTQNESSPCCFACHSLKLHLQVFIEAKCLSYLIRGFDYNCILENCISLGFKQVGHMKINNH